MFFSKLLNKYYSFPKQAKASFWFAFCSFTQKGISLFTTPIFTRLLSTSDYGILSVYSTWENLLLIIASLNLAAGVYLRGLIKFELDQEKFTASLQSLSVIIMTCIFCLYLLFSSFWSKLLDLSFPFMLLMFIDMYMVTAFHFWSARQRVNFEYRNLIIVTLVNAILKPTIGIIAVYNTCETDKVFVRIFVYALCDVLVFGWFFLTTFLGKGQKFSTQYWKYALGYNLPLVPHYLSQMVLNQSDRVMIKSLTDAGSAGIYSVAYTAATVLLIINQAILNTYNPWMYKKIKAGGYVSINNISIGLLVLIATLNLVLICFAPEAIKILAPKKYYEAIWTIPPVASSVFFMFMYSLFSNFEFYYEKTKFMMAASVGGAVLNIILNYVFIQLVGYIAAGYTTLFCYLCYCICHYYVMKSILKKQLGGMKVYEMKKIIGLSVAFVLIAGCSMILYNYMILRYIILLSAFTAAIMYRKKLVVSIKLLLDFKNS